MEETPLTPEAGTDVVQTTILQRMAPPFFSFSFVLFLSLLTSQIVVLPRIATFRVGAMDVSVDEAIMYQRSLRAEVASLEEQRNRLVLPHIDDQHDALMRRKRATPSIVDVRSRIESTMRTVAATAGAIVRIDAIQLDMATASVTVRGAINDPKPSSMAVLGAALEAVRALDGVADLASPPLTREELPGGGYRSPFTFTFHLTV